MDNFHRINIVTYTCDFGNVILGKSSQKSFRLTNCGKLPISFALDKKTLNNANITVEPDKVQKIQPNQSVLFKAVITSRKNQKQFGLQRFRIPVDIKNGPQYTVEFVANLTIPEISMSTDNVDFDRVCVNTRKTIKIRLENNKEITCEWSFQNKPEVPSVALANPPEGVRNSKSKDDAPKFTVSPHHGTLYPGQKTTIDVMFTPVHEKVYTEKLQFKCNQNQKNFVLNVKGQGINYACEMEPVNVELGPVLPYDNSAIQAFEIRNPMDHPIELYSLDFDKQYIEEEEILKRIESLNPASPSFTGEPLFLPLRKPGGEFWSSIRQQDERCLQMNALRVKLAECDDRIAPLQKLANDWADFERDKKERAERPEDFKDITAVPQPVVALDEVNKQKAAELEHWNSID